ncbi:flagellar export chaperone FliS [Saccharospirillum salsuginis]|nr:flagellar export chaperone FliS [Saccharospirillum salsuginis]
MANTTSGQRGEFMYAQGIKQYQSVSTETSIMDADPHKLIQLLFEGALARISTAKGHMERKEYDRKSKMINSAIDIIGGLQDSLNMETGDLAMNLERLYDYMIRRLFEANARNDQTILDEVSGLLSQIKTAWDDIREQALAESTPEAR